MSVVSLVEEHVFAIVVVVVVAVVLVPPAKQLSVVADAMFRAQTRPKLHSDYSRIQSLGLKVL